MEETARHRNVYLVSSPGLCFLVSMSPVGPATHSLWSDVCPLTGLELGEARTVD